MSKPEIKKISLMASHDWTMRKGMAEFLDYVKPVFKWKNKEYELELTRVIANPLIAGENLSKFSDLIVDRTTHWNFFYRSWAHQAMNSQARMVNNTYTFFVFDKHSTYDLMARAIHPDDRFPKTVLLPQFSPWNDEQQKEYWWKYRQNLIIEHTEHGHDEKKRWVDYETVNKKFEDALRSERKSQIVRDHFYYAGNYIKEVIEKEFQNHFPLYLKKAYGGGGSKVFKIENMDELYEKYDRTEGETFHLQEAIEPYEVFYRAMGLGPIIFPMIYQPDKPLHEHYSPEKPVLNPDIFYRLESYVMFINSYHRWTYNSFECLLRDGHLHPIDFANACPDSQFTSLHAHFPLLIVSLLKWLSFCAITEKDMKIDLEMTRYLNVLNSQEISQEEKFAFCRKLSEEYFEIEKFQEFCEKNCTSFEDQMVSFYDEKFDEIIEFAIEFSNFPEYEHDKFYNHYKNIMENYFKRNTKKYLTPYIIGAEGI